MEEGWWGGKERGLEERGESSVPPPHKDIFPSFYICVFVMGVKKVKNFTLLTEEEEQHIIQALEQLIFEYIEVMKKVKDAETLQQYLLAVARAMSVFIFSCLQPIKWNKEKAEPVVDCILQIVKEGVKEFHENETSSLFGGIK